MVRREISLARQFMSYWSCFFSSLCHQFLLVPVSYLSTLSIRNLCRLDHKFLYPCVNVFKCVGDLEKLLAHWMPTQGPLSQLVTSPKAHSTAQPLMKVQLYCSAYPSSGRAGHMVCVSISWTRLVLEGLNYLFRAPLVKFLLHKSTTTVSGSGSRLIGSCTKTLHNRISKPEAVLGSNTSPIVT
jgi:hypothetical protein